VTDEDVNIPDPRVSLDGAQIHTSTAFFRLPPLRPVQRDRFQANFFLLLTWREVTFAEFPLVEMPTATSPERAQGLDCREKT